MLGVLYVFRRATPYNIERNALPSLKTLYDFVIGFPNRTVFMRLF